MNDSKHLCDNMNNSMNKSYIIRAQIVIISMMRGKVDKSYAVPADKVFFVLDW